MASSCLGPTLVAALVIAIYGYIGFMFDVLIAYASFLDVLFLLAYNTIM